MSSTTYGLFPSPTFPSRHDDTFFSFESCEGLEPSERDDPVYLWHAQLRGEERRESSLLWEFLAGDATRLSYETAKRVESSAFSACASA